MPQLTGKQGTTRSSGQGDRGCSHVWESEVEKNIQLPDGVGMGLFRPVAYYDKHMDCIRVYTHDRSVTELRVSEVFTVFENNSRGATQFEPEFVGMCIKGVRKLFDEIGLNIHGVYRLAEVIDAIVKYAPGVISTQSRLVFSTMKNAGDLPLTLDEAA